MAKGTGGRGRDQGDEGGGGYPSKYLERSSRHADHFEVRILEEKGGEISGEGGLRGVPVNHHDSQLEVGAPTMILTGQGGSHFPMCSFNT